VVMFMEFPPRTAAKLTASRKNWDVPISSDHYRCRVRATGAVMISTVAGGSKLTVVGDQPSTGVPSSLNMKVTTTSL
jgi:hypothetical protein